VVAEKKHPRRLAREGVFQALYSIEISREAKAKVLADLINRYDYDEQTVEFVSKLFFKSLENSALLEENISKYLENWEFNRVAVLDQILLKMSACELLFIDDVPPKVSIAEAIEIAKKYSTEDSSAFVNGILDAIYKDQIETESKRD
jgi:N utilization substance protein B